MAQVIFRLVRWPDGKIRGYTEKVYQEEIRGLPHVVIATTVAGPYQSPRPGTAEEPGECSALMARDLYRDLMKVAKQECQG